MPTTGLGLALKRFRETRTFSVREFGTLSGIDHAYIYRLETGEKTNPSEDVIEKLLKYLKPPTRDAFIIKWLANNPDTDPELVEYVLNNPSVSFDIFVGAAGIRHRGTTRPDPETLINKVTILFGEEDN
ncbi:MAG: helix-turn-helix domain-containing protein [Methylophilus sp.]|uniref:helix-turn-helix domain-containing protein n=1 Tax=Methylophilus sp. TaxID=29541 RepID=UPI003F9FD24B